jgi:hypothetical protein
MICGSRGSSREKDVPRKDSSLFWDSVIISTFLLFGDIITPLIFYLQKNQNNGPHLSIITAAAFWSNVIARLSAKRSFRRPKAIPVN